MGCVPADVSEGIGLSAAVAGAVPEAMDAVVDLISEHNRVWEHNLVSERNRE